MNSRTTVYTHVFNCGEFATIENEQWLKNKNKDTVLFLGVWEQFNTPRFNSLAFEGIRNGAGRNGFFLSANTWMRSLLDNSSIRQLSDASAGNKRRLPKP